MGLSGLQIKVTGVGNIQSKLDKLSADLRDKAISAALNKTGAKAKTEMVRAITDEYNIKRSEVSARMRLIGANKNNLMVVLDPFASGTKGRALNLIHFLDKKGTMAEARRRKREGKRATSKVGGRELPILYFKIKKTGPSKPIPGTFLGNNGRTVFMRVGKARLPIKAASVIGVPQMFNTRKITARVIDRINRELPVEVDRAIKMVMERWGK